MQHLKFISVGELKRFLANFDDKLPVVFRRDEEVFLDCDISNTRIDFLKQNDDFTFVLEHDDDPEQIESSVAAVLLDVN